MSLKSYLRDKSPRMFVPMDNVDLLGRVEDTVSFDLSEPFAGSVRESADGSHALSIEQGPVEFPDFAGGPVKTITTYAPDVQSDMSPWGSGGGTGTGTPGAASPMLIDLDKYTTDRHLSLPGRAGNYASIPDVNILSAGVDRGERGGGEAVYGIGSTWETGVTPPDLPPAGSAITKAFKHTRSSGGGYQGRYLHTNPRFSVVGGTTYGLSFYTKGPSAHWARLIVQWYDSGGAYLSGSTLAATGELSASWFRVSGTATAPATAVSARLLFFTIGGAAGDVTYYTAVQIQVGSVTTFVPSTRIVGDLDLRADLAPIKWGDPVWPVTLAKWEGGGEGFGSWTFSRNTSGNLTLGLPVPISGQCNATVRSMVDGERSHVRVTRQASTGEVNFYTENDLGSWVPEGTTVSSIAGALPISPFNVNVGALRVSGSNPTEGDFHSWEIRDGIDGPVVASYDFDTAPSRADTLLTTPEGHALTIHQANVLGVGKAELRGGRPDKVAWLPGAAGNYLSVADVNLLDADSAHTSQSIGGWGGIQNVTGGGFLSGGGEGAFGGSFYQFLGSADGFRILRCLDATTAVPVVVGSTISASARVKSPSLGRTAMLRFHWLDDVGATVGYSSTSAYAPFDGLDWTDFPVTAVVPTGATKVRLYLYIGAEALAAEYFKVDTAVIRTGADTTFVPSHRVTGDIDLRARVALKDWGASGMPTLLSRWSAASKSYILCILGGAVRLYWSSDGVAQGNADSTVLLSSLGQSSLWVRATRNTTTGDVNFYTSTDGTLWTQLGITVSTTASGHDGLGVKSLEFGLYGNGASGPWVGTLLEAEIRDGIDGPIVARFDADDPAGFAPGATNLASYVDGTTQHSVVLRASGNATTEVVDRNTWGLTGVEWLSLPTRDELNAGSGESLHIAVNAQTRTSALGRRLLGKLNSSNYGWDIESRGTYERFQFAGTYLDTTQLWSTGNSVLVEAWRDAAANTISMGIDGVDVTATRDGNADASTTANVSTARAYDNAGSWIGKIYWYALFRRVLTTTERTTLAAWNGTVATEPSWLRPLAVFYTNADDPVQRMFYEQNDVINLAAIESYAAISLSDTDMSVWLDDSMYHVFADGSLSPGVLKGHWAIAVKVGDTWHVRQLAAEPIDLPYAKNFAVLDSVDIADMLDVAESGFVRRSLASDDITITPGDADVLSADWHIVSV